MDQQITAVIINRKEHKLKVIFRMCPKICFFELEVVNISFFSLYE